MPKAKKRKAKSTASTTTVPPPLPPVSLSVSGIKGFESFPTDPKVLGACVTVDTIDNNEQPSEIGSGACIHSTNGLILTAGHAAPTIGAVRRISFPSGATYDATCIQVGVTYDLSLLQIHLTTPCQQRRGKKQQRDPPFPSIHIAQLPALPRTRLVCVGQPGTRATQRFEANVGRCISQARQPLQEQLEVGGMVHNCPVYGGSSGSPLLHGDTGELVGVHVGFDHNRFEAQAVTLQAVREFLVGCGEIVGLSEEMETEGGDSDSGGDGCGSPLPLAKRLRKRIEQRTKK